MPAGVAVPCGRDSERRIRCRPRRCRHVGCASMSASCGLVADEVFEVRASDDSTTSFVRPWKAPSASKVIDPLRLTPQKGGRLLDAQKVMRAVGRERELLSVGEALHHK